MSIILTPSVLSAVNEGSTFTDTFTVQQDVVLIPPTLENPNPVQETPGLITYCNITQSHPEPGISITITGLNTSIVTVEIHGDYENVFDQKYFQYKNSINSSVTTTSNPANIPEIFFAVTHYHPDQRTSSIATFTVDTNLGSAVISKTINNDWTASRNAFINLLSRQTVG